MGWGEIIPPPNFMLVDEINKKLADVFGKGVDGLPKFRVVWSNEQTEKRFGTFEEWYGDIFVRSVTGVREVPKYYYLDNVWVLEHRMPNDNPELFEKVTYEPIYVFPQNLPLNWDVVSFVCNSIINPPKREWRTEKMDLADEGREFERDKKRLYDKLVEMGDSDILYKLSMKEAILNPKGD